MSGEHLIYICEICQTVLDEHHCKAVCPNCGRMFDCSDLPLIAANAMVDDDQNLVARPGADIADMLPPSTDGSASSGTPADDAPPHIAKDGSVANLP